MSLEGVILAVVARRDRICNGVNPSPRRAAMRTAAAPAMNGVAIEVPKTIASRQLRSTAAREREKEIDEGEERETDPKSFQFHRAREGKSRECFLRVQRESADRTCRKSGRDSKRQKSIPEFECRHCWWRRQRVVDSRRVERREGTCVKSRISIESTEGREEDDRTNLQIQNFQQRR